MIHTPESGRKSIFSGWMRTGRMMPVRYSDGIELKYNPWHDPEDGRFTFAGSGRHHGAGGAGSTVPAPRPASRDVSWKPRAAVTPRDGPRSSDPGKREPHPRSGSRASPVDRLNPAVEFVSGVGEGVSNVAKGTVTGVYAAMTTNPVTTVSTAGRGIVGMIDTAIAAEAVPARIRIPRALDGITHATARETGRTTGSVVANTALAVAPGAGLAKVSALRRFRGAPPRISYDPPQIKWVKENLGPEKDWKIYNDGAPGAKPGEAPALIRTMPNGSTRPVKFDGVLGDYLIDRKLGIRDAAHARAQVLRQSEVLAQHCSIGTWEVPNSLQKTKALKLLRKMNVRNIKVRIVKP